VNPIYPSESDELDTSSGFQEMPYWSISQAEAVPLKSVKATPGIVLETITSLPQDGLPHAGNTIYTGGS